MADHAVEPMAASAGASASAPKPDRTKAESCCGSRINAGGVVVAQPDEEAGRVAVLPEASGHRLADDDDSSFGGGPAAASPVGGSKPATLKVARAGAEQVQVQAADGADCVDAGASRKRSSRRREYTRASSGVKRVAGVKKVRMAAGSQPKPGSTVAPGWHFPRRPAIEDASVHGVLEPTPGQPTGRPVNTETSAGAIAAPAEVSFYRPEPTCTVKTHVGAPMRDGALSRSSRRPTTFQSSAVHCRPSPVLPSRSRLSMLTPRRRNAPGCQARSLSVSNPVSFTGSGRNRSGSSTQAGAS